MMKERTTLWDFMRDHTCLVEDLNIAAAELGCGKHAALSNSLKKYANELKEFDHYLCKEYHSPFDEEQMWVLEYNEEHNQFHYNNSCDEGVFRQALFSFGWMPVCIVPDCYSLDDEFGKLLQEISKKKLSYKAAVNSIYAWFSQKNNI